MKESFCVVLIFVCLLSLSVESRSANAGEYGERWKLAGVSRTDTLWYIDNETISASSGVFSFWVRSVPDNAGTVNEDKETPPKQVLKDIQERNFGDYEYTEALWEIDCTNDKFRILYFAAYGRNGEGLNSSLTPDAPWTTVIQGSASETLWETVCGDKR